MQDKEFDVLGEEDLALLRRRFERMYMNQKNVWRSSGMCYWCGKHRHFIAEGPKPWRSSPSTSTVRGPTTSTARVMTKEQEQVRAEAKEECWSEEEAGDGCRCKRHRLKLLLLFIELK
jgi:hypothetical protein